MRSKKSWNNDQGREIGEPFENSPIVLANKSDVLQLIEAAWHVPVSDEGRGIRCTMVIATPIAGGSWRATLPSMAATKSCCVE
jgi:hypothetical protein